MIISRDNHYVPQMYLKYWASDNKIWVYNLLVSHPKVPNWIQKSVSGVAFQDNLYVRVENDQDFDDFEHDFSARFETPAKEPLDKIVHGEKLRSDEWIHISEYIAAQYVRTPAFYQYLRGILPKITKEAIDEVFERLSKIEALPEIHNQEPQLLPITVNITNKNQIDDDHVLAEIGMVVGKSTWLFAIQNALKPNSAILTTMRDVKWSIVTSPSNFSFPTSDNPVSIVHENKHGWFEVTTGISQGNNLIIFPVSPHKILIGKMKNRLDYRFTADTILYQKLNSVIVKNAFLQIYCEC